MTVMRRGKVVGGADMPIPADRLVEMMFGEVIVAGERPTATVGGPCLEVNDVTLSERLITVEELSLQVNSGEILGLAGLEGSGQRSLLRACAGLLKPTRGDISIGGRAMGRQHYRRFLDAGVHFLPAGRLEEGLVEGLTITEHFELVSGRDSFFVDWDGAEADATHKVSDHFIKGTPASTAESLSGGNQQRLLLAMMPPDITLLLMEHPTRGLDIESAEWVWGRLLERRDHGTGIVFASADLDELLRYSDRIAVFFSGRVLKVVDAATTTPEELGYLIGGKEPAQ